MNEQYVLSRRERKKLNCKYAILRAARQLMMEQGVDVSIEDIANKADISYPTFFNYFPTKAELYYAIYLEEIEDIQEFAAIELKSEGSAAKRIIRLLDALMQDFSRYRYLDLYLAGEVARRTAESGGTETISQMFLLEIQSGMASGEFREALPARAYALLITGIVFSTSFYSCEPTDYHSMLEILLNDMQA